MIAVDTAQKRFLRNEEIKERLSRARPYNQWVDGNISRLEPLPAAGGTTPLISTGSRWKFLDDGTDQGVAWRAERESSLKWISSADDRESREGLSWAAGPKDPPRRTRARTVGMKGRCIDTSFSGAVSGTTYIQANRVIMPVG